MTRYVFAKEGITTISSVRFEPESLRWDEVPIPVVWSFIFDDPTKLLGTATDLQRDEDGTLTAEISWKEEHEKLISAMIEQKEAFLTIFVNRLVEEDDRKCGGVRKLLSGQLRCISAINGSDPWKEMT